MSHNKYAVVRNDKVVYYLNGNLAIANKVTDEELEQIKALHVKKLDLFDIATQAAAANNTDLLKSLAAELQQIEFDMQKAWHFPQDHTFHEWYAIPGCRCPKMDNAEARGVDRRIYSGACPIHGQGISSE